MKGEKIQLINRTWHYFYHGRILDLGVGPDTSPPVSERQAIRDCADAMLAFEQESDKLEVFKPLKERWHE